jgi:hypothetical protein
MRDCSKKYAHTIEQCDPDISKSLFWKHIRSAGDNLLPSPHFVSLRRKGNLIRTALFTHFRQNRDFRVLCQIRTANSEKNLGTAEIVPDKKFRSHFRSIRSRYNYGPIISERESAGTGVTMFKCRSILFYDPQDLMTNRRKLSHGGVGFEAQMQATRYK